MVAKSSKPPDEPSIEAPDPERSALAGPRSFPVMPLRNSVLFPQQVVPLAVGRERSLRLLKDVRAKSRAIVVVAQRDPADEEPDPTELYDVGCIATILKIFDMPDGNKSVVIQGTRRVRVLRYERVDPYHVAACEEITTEASSDITADALVSNLRGLVQRVAELANYITTEHASVLMNLSDPSQLADFAAAALNISVEDRESILETFDVKKRLERVTYFYNREIEILELGSKIQSKVQGEISRTQREYYLREQLKAIRTELGEYEDEGEELHELRTRIESAHMSQEAERVALKELDRLSRIPQASAEHTVARTYIDWLIELPWSTASQDEIDIAKAAKVLDQDHYGLEKLKRRVLEYLAVRQLAGDGKAPILCFAGPPGVGKTSLGVSIARAIGRKFVRISLGGVRNEAEIRGHRRTYIGALPGRIIQGIRRAGTNNPLFMLDEIDKMGTDFRGDPASALLEVLDPEQNDTFSDHYLEVPFDLSRVMFIATANFVEHAPPALRDRMEILDLPGYIEEEKLGIARRFLVPKQLAAHGLARRQLRFSVAALRRIIRAYTREAGVRGLERQIASVCRGIAVQVVEKKLPKAGRSIDPTHLSDYLGPERFYHDAAERIRRAGIATGVAWTPTGGELLFIEATEMPGKGNLMLTGHLGDVMRESAETARSYIRANARELGIDSDRFPKNDIHVHVPAGAVPKDGPSAGVTIFVALLSLLSGRRVRHDVAMTGEITLRGLVLPVGGIKEKVLAAQRAGIKRFVLPQKSRPDLDEIPERVRNKMTFHFAAEMSELAPLVFEGPRAKGAARRKPRPGRQPSATRADAKAPASNGTRSSTDSPTPR